jgi:hypothetical protein
VSGVFIFKRDNDQRGKDAEIFTGLADMGYGGFDDLLHQRLRQQFLKRSTNG